MKLIIYLELDNNLLIDNSETIYSTENLIYIIQFPNFKEIVVSYGILKKRNDEHEIIHLCSTEKDSSGSPILNIKKIM